jgi:hypothetical protein
VLSTFPHPRYELIPTGVVHDGDAEVRQYYRDTRVAFPDQRHEMIALRHSDDAVICEFYLLPSRPDFPSDLGFLAPARPVLKRLSLRHTGFGACLSARECV